MSVQLYIHGHRIWPRVCEEKIYFVHIPKTAGNSVRQFLNRYSCLANPGKIKKEREHKFGVDNAERFGHPSFNTPYFPNYTKEEQYANALFAFTIVRNPFDLLVSYYFHNAESKNKNHIDQGWGNVNKYHNFTSFKEFIEFYCTCSPAEWHVPFLNKNLYFQIFDSQGGCKVKFVLYYENLRNNLYHLLKYIDVREILRYGLERRMVSAARQKKHYSEFYDAKTVRLVQKKCCWELNTFGYDFNQKSKNFQMLDVSDLTREMGDSS